MMMKSSYRASTMLLLLLLFCLVPTATLAGTGGGNGAGGSTEDDDDDCYDRSAFKKKGPRNGKISCDDESMPNDTSAPASRPLDYTESAPAPSRPLDYSSESAPAPSPPTMDAPTTGGGQTPAAGPSSTDPPASQSKKGDKGGGDGPSTDPPASQPTTGDGGGGDGPSTDPPASQPTTGDGGNDDGPSTDPPASQPTTGDGGDDGPSTGPPALQPTTGDGGDDGPSTGPPASQPTMGDGGDGDGGDDACRTDNGKYGALDGDELVVPFSYTVELSEDVPYAEYVNTVIPALEVDMNDYVVPFLFENCADSAVEIKQQTGNDNNLRRRRHLAVTIVGMTSDPYDSITNQNGCDVENCYGMLGQVTLYLQTTADNSDGRRALQQEDETKTVSEQLRTALKQGMDDGQFDNNPPIARVTFVDGNWDDGEGGDGSGGSGGTAIEDGDRSTDAGDGGANAKLIAPLVVAGGLALIVIAAILVRRRRPRPAADAENALVVGSATTPTPSDTAAASENLRLPPARSGSDIVSVN